MYSLSSLLLSASPELSSPSSESAKVSLMILELCFLSSMSFDLRSFLACANFFWSFLTFSPELVSPQASWAFFTFPRSSLILCCSLCFAFSSAFVSLRLEILLFSLSVMFFRDVLSFLSSFSRVPTFFLPPQTSSDLCHF